MFFERRKKKKERDGSEMRVLIGCNGGGAQRTVVVGCSKRVRVSFSRGVQVNGGERAVSRREIDNRPLTTWPVTQLQTAKGAKRASPKE
jgi:hypothetical protein